MCSSNFLALATVVASLWGEAGATASVHRRDGAAEAGQCWCSQDTDYAGGDLGWVETGTVSECCSTCSLYPGCTVSVFFGKRCYLKNSSVPLSSSSNHVACKPHAGRPGRGKSSSKEDTRVVRSASCRAYGCGGRFSPSQSCQCNHGCKAHGNCCYDYVAQCSSHAKKGKGDSNISILVNSVSCAAYGCSYYRSGSPCQCTARCREYKNCCHDYKATCLAGGRGNQFEDDESESSTPQSSSSKTLSKTSEDTIIVDDDVGESSTVQRSSKTDAKTPEDTNDADDDVGEISTTQGSSSKTVPKTSERTRSTTADVTTETSTAAVATEEATTTASTTSAIVTTLVETTGKVTATEASETATVTFVGTSATTLVGDATSSSSVPSTSQTGISSTTDATYGSTAELKHTTAEATASSSSDSSSSSSSSSRPDSISNEGKDSSSASTTQSSPEHVESSTTRMASDMPTVQTTNPRPSQDSSTTVQGKKSSSGEEKGASDETTQQQSTSSSSSSKSGDLSVALAASLADALNRSKLTMGGAAVHQTSSDDEESKKKKDSKIVILKKFLQTTPHFGEGRKSLHSAPAWIALLAGATLLATFLVRARTQPRRTAEQDAEAEQLLEPTNNILVQRGGGAPLLQQYAA